MEIDEVKKDLILALFDKDAVKFGKFTLKSGIQSPIYFDLRVIISHPEIMRTICNILETEVIKQTEMDVICGVPYTALPLAAIISERQRIPMIIKRKEQKTYGTGKLIEGKYTQDTKCVILEDVVSTGSSIIDTAKALRAHGMVVKHAIVVLNRNCPAADNNLEMNQIKLHSIITVDKLLQVLVDECRIAPEQKWAVEKFLRDGQSIPPACPSIACDNGHAKMLLTIMHSKQSNLCLSADCTDWQQVLKVTEAIGRQICAVKTHMDAISFNDFGEITTFKEKLLALAKQLNFVIIEDRKFADIGSTVEKQLTSKPFSIGEWAQFCTVHGIPGPGMLKVFQTSKMGVILIAEMSSAGNIPCLLPEYKTKTLEMCKGFEDTVVGFVSQSGVGKNEGVGTPYLQFTPGVSLNSTGDSLGQQYVSVKDAVLERGADVIIVGRGIIKQEEDKWVQVAEDYRQQGWNAFQRKVNGN